MQFAVIFGEKGEGIDSSARLLQSLSFSACRCAGTWRAVSNSSYGLPHLHKGSLPPTTDVYLRVSLDPGSTRARPSFPMYQGFDASLTSGISFP